MQGAVAGLLGLYGAGKGAHRGHALRGADETRVAGHEAADARTGTGLHVAFAIWQVYDFRLIACHFARGH